MSINKVYICGHEASAKVTLRALFDGHNKVVNNQFEIGISLLYDSFFKLCASEILKYDNKY